MSTENELVDVERLKRLAEAVDGQYPLGELQDEGVYECPLCQGEGNIDGAVQFSKAASGIQVFGIGDSLNNMKAFVAAANPAAILSLIAEVEGLRRQVREEALEEAAKLLDSLHCVADGRHNYFQYSASRIRALKSPSPTPAPEQTSEGELHFNAQRLRNVAKLVGLENAVPEDDATLDAARGSVLGMIAAKLRASSQPPSVAMTDKSRAMVCDGNDQNKAAARKEFEEVFDTLDFSRDHDVWGREQYKHPHVQSLWQGFWQGWQARGLQSSPTASSTAHGARKQGELPPLPACAMGGRSCEPTQT